MKIKSKNLSLIQAPIALGQGFKGVDQAPQLLLKSGLIGLIESLGWSVKNNQVVDPHNLKWNSPQGLLPAHQLGAKIKFPKELGEACADLSLFSEAAHREKQFALTLGGDHSIAIGSVEGALKARPNLGVIWVDAHGDFNTPETSPSGNIHGMPLSFLAGHMQKYKLPSFSWITHFLKPEQLVLIGIRSIDSEERKLMKKWGANVFTMTEIDRYGIGGVMEMAKKILFKKGKRPVHLSYDIDAVDPHFAPATGTKVRGGLNYREAHYIAEYAASLETLVSMDLVEINPTFGQVSKNETIELGLELIGSALGKKIY